MQLVNSYFAKTDQEAVMKREERMRGSKVSADGKESYSIRKKRVTPKRYSPPPLWERWEKYPVTSGRKKRSGSSSRASSSGREESGTRKKSVPKKFSPSQTSQDTITISKKPASLETLKDKKPQEEMHSTTVSDPKKSKRSDDTVKQDGRSVRKKKRLETRPIESSNGKQERKYGTRQRRTAPTRYSPTPISDRKMLRIYREYSASKNSSSTSSAEKISLEKWADVLRRQPIVLLERYVPAAPVCLGNEGDDCSSVDSGSNCCTPTPSWMDEDEIASYYTSENRGDASGTCSPIPSLEETGGPVDESTDSERDSCACTSFEDVDFDASAKDEYTKKDGPVSSFDVALSAAVIEKTVLNSEKCGPLPLSSDTTVIGKTVVDSKKRDLYPLSTDIAVTESAVLNSKNCDSTPTSNSTAVTKELVLGSKTSGPVPTAVKGKNKLDTKKSDVRDSTAVATVGSDGPNEKSNSSLNKYAATTEKNSTDSNKTGLTSSLKVTAAVVSDSKKVPQTQSLKAAVTTRKNGSAPGVSNSARLSTNIITRKKSLNRKKDEPSSPSKNSVNYVLDPKQCSRFLSSDENRTESINGLNTEGYNTVQSQSSLKAEKAPKEQSLILIRHDYSRRSFSPLSEDSDTEYDQDKNKETTAENERKANTCTPLSDDSSLANEDLDSVKPNRDLTAEDVFEILFGPRIRSPTPQKDTAPDPPKKIPDVSGLTSAPLCNPSKDTEKERYSELESRCLSSLSDDSTFPAEGRYSPVFSTRDVFEIVCGSRAYSPAIFRYDTPRPVPASIDAPQLRKRPHSPAVSLPERSSPDSREETRSFKRRSLSNNFEDREPNKSSSSSSLNNYGRRRGYATRKKRSAPKRYSPTPEDSDDTTNSSADNGYYFDRKRYATRAMRSAPKRYSHTPFYDAYYYYENDHRYVRKHKDQSSKKSLTDTANKLDNGNKRRVRKLSVKSVSGDSLKDDDDEKHWAKFHGFGCTKQCGSLTIVRDTPVPRDLNDEFRAKKTAPPQVSVADSKIPDAGHGAWAKEPIPARTRFGPYEGKLVPAKVFTSYAWLIRKNGKPNRCVDATEPGLSNWMRFVNCARHDGEQNLEAFQCHGNIYYKTIRHVNPHEELLVWYGDEYGRQLGIDPGMCDAKDEASWAERTFKCPACPLVFASPLYLESHKKWCRMLKSVGGLSKETREASKNRRGSSPVGFRRSKSESDSSDIRPLITSYSGPKQLASSVDESERVGDKYSFERDSEEKFFCEKCDIIFNRKYHLQRHLRTRKHEWNTLHVPRRDNCKWKTPIVCEKCNKQFPSESSRTRHLNAVHDGDYYYCHECHLRFSGKLNLRRHVSIHHTCGKGCFCSKCSVLFDVKGSSKLRNAWC